MRPHAVLLADLSSGLMCSLALRKPGVVHTGTACESIVARRSGHQLGAEHRDYLGEYCS